MKARVVIQKTFDDGKEFSKEWEQGDFKEFFSKEGVYLDTLSDILNRRGLAGDEFTITYIAKLVK